MPVERIEPKNEAEWLQLRLQDITSTEVSALFGLSPYTTEFELWHRKKSGQLSDFHVSDRMKWGTRLEKAIAEGVAKDEGWKVRPMKEYLRIPELRIGSSFDYSIEGKDIEPGILEVKNVDSLIFKQQWEKDGDGVYEAPPHIEIQVQHQFAVSLRQYAWIAAFVGGNDVVLIKREPDLAIIQAIKDRVKKFWVTIEAGHEPEPDFEKDSEFIAKLYGYAEPGKVMALEGNEEFNTLALRHRELGAAVKQCNTERDGLKAQMLTIIGDAEKCTSDLCSISAGLIGPAQVSYERKGYRAFKLNWPRGKKK